MKAPRPSGEGRGGGRGITDDARPPPRSSPHPPRRPHGRRGPWGTGVRNPPRTGLGVRATRALRGPGRVPPALRTLRAGRGPPIHILARPPVSVPHRLIPSGRPRPPRTRRRSRGGSRRTRGGGVEASKSPAPPSRPDGLEGVGGGRGVRDVRGPRAPTGPSGGSAWPCQGGGRRPSRGPAGVGFTGPSGVGRRPPLANGARRAPGAVPRAPSRRATGPGAHARPCTGSGREAGLPGGAPGEPIRAARVAAPGETPRSSRGGQLMGGTTGIRRLRTPPRGPPSAATRAEGGAPRPLPRHARDPEGTPTPQGRARARRIPTPQGRGLPRTPKAASEGAARGEGPPARRRPSEGPPWGADGPNGRGRPRRRPPRAPRGPRGRRRGNRQGPVPRSEAPSRVPGRGPHGEGPTRGRGVLREDPTPEGVGGRTTPPVPGVQGDV